MEAVDWTDFYAVHVFALDAVLGNNEGHGYPEIFLGRTLNPTVYVREVVAVDARSAVLEKTPQRKLDTGESDVMPRYISLGDERGVEAFGARADLRRAQLGAKEHVHLLRMQDVHDGEQGADFNVGQGLFVRFTRGRLLQRFVVFHEARGERPVAVTRLDGPAAEHDAAVLGFRNAADDDLGIFVVNGVTSRADVPRQVLTLWNPHHHGGATIAAVVHE